MALEKNGKKKWETYKNNNEIIGDNDFPQGLGCNIF